MKIILNFVFKNNICIFRIEETEEEIQKRLNKWDNFLETDESKTDIEESSKISDNSEEKLEVPAPSSNP